MSCRDVEISLKSTLDKLMGDLAVSLSTGKPVFSFDLDDPANEREIQAGSDHALVYQYNSLAEEPRHPLYSASFLIGAKTTDDPGNYQMADLLVDLRDLFKVGDSFPVSDWSEVEEGAPAPEESGVLIIKSVQSTPQSFEKQSGIRLMQVQAQMISYGED